MRDSKLKEFILVILVSVLVGVFVALKWDIVWVDYFSEKLFLFFLPGIMMAIAFNGGVSDANEIIVFFGVVAQALILWWIIQFFRKKIFGIRK